MTDLPLAPIDEEGVPKCARACPYYRTRLHPADLLADCAIDPTMGPDDYICRPRIRELVALSRRRCDGCEHGHATTWLDTRCTDVVCVVDPEVRQYRKAGWHCGDWAAKR